MDSFLPLHAVVCLVVSSFISLVGGARKSKHPAPAPPGTNVDVEAGLAAVDSYSSQGELDLSDWLDSDLSNSRVNYWDEDYTVTEDEQEDKKPVTTEERDGTEEETEEDYTEDVEQEPVVRVLPDERDKGDVGIMKRLTTVSSDTYLTRIHKELDCDHPEDCGAEARNKLMEMMSQLPFRPLLILQERSITAQNYATVHEKLASVAHEAQRRRRVGREERRAHAAVQFAYLCQKGDTNVRVLEAIGDRRCKLMERAPTYVSYGSEPARGDRDHDEDTLDCEEQQRSRYLPEHIDKIV